MDLVLTRESIDSLERILERELLNNGADHAFVVHASGSLIAETGSMPLDQVQLLASVSAANFSATQRMARLLGQDEFTLMFHKGTHHNIHFCPINNELILVTLFGNEVSLGMISFGSLKAIKEVLIIFGDRKDL